VERRPRILHVYKDFWPPIVGGIEKSLHWMAHGLSGRYEVSALVCSRRLRSRERRDGPVRVIEAGEWGRFAAAPAAPLFPWFLRRESADLLHFHHPNPTGEIAWLLARPRGRIVVTYHSDIVRQERALRFYAPWLRRFLRAADVILPTSPNYIASSPFLRPLASRCVVVPLGIPLQPYESSAQGEEAARRLRERYGASPAAPLLLFAGQFREYKGLTFLIEALARLSAAGARLRAALAGDGPMRPAIESQARAAGLADRVFFPGRVDDAALIAHYRACDVFVLPSHRRSEAFGLVQVEAMACGKPVISCALDTGVPFVNRDGETGLIVPPADASALAEAIEKLLAGEDLRRRLGEAGRRRAREEFSVERMLGRVSEVYAEVLSRPPRRPPAAGAC